MQTQSKQKSCLGIGYSSISYTQFEMTIFLSLLIFLEVQNSLWKSIMDQQHWMKNVTLKTAVLFCGLKQQLAYSTIISSYLVACCHSSWWWHSDRCEIWWKSEFKNVLCTGRIQGSVCTNAKHQLRVTQLNWPVQDCLCSKMWKRMYTFSPEQCNDCKKWSYWTEKTVQSHTLSLRCCNPRWCPIKLTMDTQAYLHLNWLVNKQNYGFWSI